MIFDLFWDEYYVRITYVPWSSINGVHGHISILILLCPLMWFCDRRSANGNALWISLFFLSFYSCKWKGFIALCFILLKSKSGYDQDLVMAMIPSNQLYSILLSAVKNEAALVDMRSSESWYLNILSRFLVFRILGSPTYLWGRGPDFEIETRLKDGRKWVLENRRFPHVASCFCSHKIIN